MEAKYIALIVIACLFIFFILLFMVLSWKYQQKHSPYMKLRNEYMEKYDKLKGQPVLLNVIETNIDLPADEHFYLIKNQLGYFEEDVQPTKGNKNSTKAMIQEYELDYEIIEQKTNYSLSNRVAKYYRENLVADLLVTNKRILLKNHQQIIEIKLSDVVKVSPIIMTIKNQIFVGIIIYTKEKLYRIKDDELNDVLLIQTLLN